MLVLTPGSSVCTRRGRGTDEGVVTGLCQCHNAPFSPRASALRQAPQIGAGQSDANITRPEPRRELGTQCSLLLHTAGLHTHAGLTRANSCQRGGMGGLGGDRGSRREDGAKQPPFPPSSIPPSVLHNAGAEIRAGQHTEQVVLNRVLFLSGTLNLINCD